MSISGGMLGSEVNRISSNKTDSRRKYTATITAGGVETRAMSVTRLDIASDFEKKYRDDITITLLLPLGTLINQIAPYQDDLTIRIRTSLPGTYDYEDVTYKAYLMEDMPNEVEMSHNPAFKDTNTTNKLSNVNVSFSLTLPLVEYLDAIRTGFIARQDPPFAILKVLFNKYVEAINFAMDEGVRSLTMVEPSNYQPRAQTIIPDNTRLVDLPDILQDKMGGIYSSGMGFYLSRRDLFFWPLYDVNRDDPSISKLHVMMPVSGHSSVLDNTYLKEGNIVTILASGKPRVVDDTLGQTYHEGDSVRYLDGNKAFEPMGTVKGGVITANRVDRNVESNVISTAKRIQTVTGGSQKITSNVYREMSRKASMNGVRVMVEWRYSNHHLIKPGMLVTLFMESRGDVKEVPGIVIGAFSKFEMETEGMSNETLLSSTVISVFIKRDDWRMDKFRSAGQQASVHTTN